MCDESVVHVGLHLAFFSFLYDIMNIFMLFKTS